MNTDQKYWKLHQQICQHMSEERNELHYKDHVQVKMNTGIYIFFFFFIYASKTFLCKLQIFF